MLLSAVSVLVVAQSSSEIPEGLMNNPVYKTGNFCPVQRSMICFYNEKASVYCTVRVGTLNKTKSFSTLKG